MIVDTERHPCFSDAARHRYARVHLPVAPECNMQCNYCKRGFDCVNEARPGVTSVVLTPSQALAYVKRLMGQEPEITVVGIAGPGDPFAQPERTLQTLRLVREYAPSMLLCVASNGLNVARYAPALGALAVSHVTLTVNAVDPEIGAKVYAWIRDQKRMYRGRIAAELLWSRQQEAIVALKREGIVVKINTIIVPGINDHHVAEVARRMADLGADIANCVPLYNVPGTEFAGVAPPPAARVTEIREQVAQHLPVMRHCARCRADAAGRLGDAIRPEWERHLLAASTLPQQGQEQRPHVAVATLEGALVNQHLGEARQLSIFSREGERYRCLEMRKTPEPGGGTARWESLARILHDCRALLVASAGDAPVTALSANGIQVIRMEGLIETGLEAVYRGFTPPLPLQSRHRCGSGCAGNGQGCL